jgi:hypothetical protein
MGESVAEATITRLKEVGDRIEADEAVKIATDKVDSEVLARFQVFSRTVIWWMIWLQVGKLYYRNRRW